MDLRITETSLKFGLLISATLTLLALGLASQLTHWASTNLVAYVLGVASGFACMGVSVLIGQDQTGHSPAAGNPANRFAVSATKLSGVLCLTASLILLLDGVIQLVPYGR